MGRCHIRNGGRAWPAGRRLPLKEAEDSLRLTEPKENGGLSESALPMAFAYTRADDMATRSGGNGQQEYRILVVAEKYRSGFWRPPRP